MSKICVQIKSVPHPVLWPSPWKETTQGSSLASDNSCPRPLVWILAFICLGPMLGF